MRLRRNKLKLTTTLREPSARSGPPAATNRPGNCPAPERSEWFGTAPTDAAAPRQTHEMNAVRRSQMAGRCGPADRKKITANGLVRRG